MAKSYWLINSNRSEVRRFIKNEKSINQTKNKLESKMENLTKRANKNN